MESIEISEILKYFSIQYLGEMGFRAGLTPLRRLLILSNLFLLVREEGDQVLPDEKTASRDKNDSRTRQARRTFEELRF